MRARLGRGTTLVQVAAIRFAKPHLARPTRQHGAVRGLRCGKWAALRPFTAVRPCRTPGALLPESRRRPGRPAARTMRRMATDVVTMDKIVALCKRRGFVFPSSEIYGGLGSTYDYGHYGVLLKTNVKNAWWHSMLSRDDVVALDSAILQHPRVWEAS